MLSRRTFIKNSMLQMVLISGLRPLLSYALTSKQSQSGQWVYLNGLYLDPATLKPARRIGAVSPVDQNHHAFLCYFTETGFEGKINLPFLPHSVLKHPDPKKPFSVIAIPRRAQVAAEIDLSQKSITRLFHPAPGGFFYGHGQIIRKKDQPFLFVSEVGQDSAEGTITIRDVNTLKVVKTLSSHGYSPHEILQMPRKDEILICNSGSKLASPDGNYVGTKFPSSISLVHVHSGKLIRKWQCPTQDKVGFFDGFAHGLVLPSGEVILATKPQEEESNDSGNIYLLTNKFEIQHLSLPENLQNRTKGQFLSIAYDEPTQQVFVSMPLGHFTVVFSSVNWNYRSHVDFKKSNGLNFSADGKSLYISNGLGQLAKASVNDPSQLKLINESGKGGTEAHLDRVWMPPLSI